ncbi:MAG: SdiA-regulated domain-containing protein [Prolixibacteraceae bacterium]|nr:SdiA-regulated domain-containing protein [Prolixibacteraceae bacterium]
MLIFILLTSLIFIQPVNAQVNSAEIPYNFNQPAKIIVLPEVLKEVSGIVMIDDENMACIEDERARIYIYSLKSNTIVISNEFGYKSDYEGIAYTGNTFYVVQSKGILYEVSDVSEGMVALNFFSLLIPSPDIEALTFDQQKNQLLIASKGDYDNHNDSKTIFSFNLNTESLEEEPFLKIPYNAVNNFLEKENVVLPPSFDKNGKIKNKPVKILASAMAINPFTNNLYVLSANEYLLFVFSQTGKIVHVELLNESFYPQAEGITFTPEGDIYISNEGRNGPPTLLFIPLKKQ